MAKHLGEQFADRRVELDGETFENCRFVRCEVVYSGGPLMSLIGCRFEGCAFVMEGAAKQTLAFLNVVYHGFGSFGLRMVEDIFNQIRTNRSPSVASSPEGSMASPPQDPTY